MPDAPGSSLRTEARGVHRWIGFVAGPLVLAAMLLVPAPDGLDPAGWRTAAVGLLMAIWWITEAIPIPVTALLPLVLFPVLGVGSIDAAAAPYANPLIFLFLGGFVIALGMQRWNLHRRIALTIIGAVGTRPGRIVFGFMLASAFLSMWVSNTATAMMMLPIGLSVAALASPNDAPPDDAPPDDASIDDASTSDASTSDASTSDASIDDAPTRAASQGEALQGEALQGEALQGEALQGGASELPTGEAASTFALVLMLGIAYACSIGGVGTLIGTPPNALLAGFLSESYGVEVGFAQWMLVGLPVVVVGLPLAYVVLTRLAFSLEMDRLPGGRALVDRERERLGSLSRPERLVGAVFAGVALLWMTRPLLADVVPGLSDAGIAVFGAVLLFVLPVDLRQGTFVLTWDDAADVPWGVLLLFGGGLSLAAAVERTGLAAWIGEALNVLAGAPLPLVLLGVAATILVLTELTSNTATTAAFLPIMASVAVGIGQNPFLLVVPAALAASCAFMLPVATPPNAIVYGSGVMTIPQMARAGVFLNIAFVGVVTLVAYLLVPLVFGVDLGVVPPWAG